MNKLVLTSLSLALITSLTACGGSDDNTTSSQASNSNATNEVLKIVGFENEYENNTISTIDRQDIQLGKGLATMTSKTIFGKSSTNHYKDYSVGDGFFVTNVGNMLGNLKNTQVTNPTADTVQVDTDLLGDNNKGGYHQTLTFKKIDISGAFNFAEKEKQGLIIYPNPNGFNKLPVSLNFPQGSVCYYNTKSISSKEIYSFSDADATQYHSLAEFENANGLPSTTPIIKVGTNNELPMIAYKDGSNTFYALELNGKVYHNIDREEKVNDYTNASPSECDSLNETAGNYMEQQLKAVYY